MNYDKIKHMHLPISIQNWESVSQDLQQSLAASLRVPYDILFGSKANDESE